MTEYDAVIVGGSIAGSTTAALLARQGARVALVEKSPNPDHYKALCTHELVAASRPVLDRLGLLEQVEAASGPHRSPEIWTRYGWVKPEASGNEPLVQGFNVRRETLDPLIREVAASTDGVDLILGAAATEVTKDAFGRPVGVRIRERGGERELGARLVIGADGRGSGVAKMTGVPARKRPHHRFGYAAYYEGLELTSGCGSQMWLLDPDVAYAFPTDGGLTVLAVMRKTEPSRVAAFKADLEGEFERCYDDLPDGPDVRAGRRVSKFVGALKMENSWRPAAAPGVAFVGDAAQVTDYLWGTGCGFALCSGEWLADAVGPALAAGADDVAVDAGLTAYRKQHRRELAPHYLMTSDYSSGRGFSVPEKLLFGGGVRDPTVARAVHRIGARMATPQRILSPVVMARAAVALARPRAAPVSG